MRTKLFHRDLAAAQRKADERAISSISTWLDEMQPFNVERDKDILLSFSTVFSVTMKMESTQRKLFVWEIKFKRN